MSEHPQTAQDEPDDRTAEQEAKPQPATREIGGPKESDPTRYGDWTVKGRCIDF